MVVIREEISINKSRALVFNLAQDYDLRLQWDPFLRNIKFLSDSIEFARGLKVWVKAHNGMEMTVEYLNYKIPEHVSMKMIDGPRMFSHFSGTWKFEELEENLTSVIFIYKFKLQFFLIPGSFIVKWILKNDMNKRLIALKLNSESGKFDTKLNL